MSAMSTAPGAPAESPHATPPPLAQRIRDTFLRPRELFASMGPSTPWAGVLGVATFVAALAMAAEPAEYYLQQMEDPVTRRGTPVELASPPSQIVLWGRVMAIFNAVVAHPFLAFAGAGLLMLIFRVVRQGRGSFVQYLTVASHALLISSLGMIVTVLLRAVSGDPEMIPTVGALAGLSAQSVVGSVLHGINLFTLWMLAVMGIGSTVVERRDDRPQSIALLIGLYLVVTLIIGILFRG